MVNSILLAERYTRVKKDVPPSSILPHIKTAAFRVLITRPGGGTDESFSFTLLSSYVNSLKVRK